LLHSSRLIRHGDFCVLPFAFNGGKKNEEGGSRSAVTLVLHISADYIHKETLYEQISNWQGPVSIAVFFDRPRQQINCVEEMLFFYLFCDLMRIKRFPITYFQLDQCDFLVHRSGNCSHQARNKTIEEIAAYPANAGRNIAREFVSTEFILLADYEHLFSQGFERKMTEIAVRENITESRVVLVYRIFEIDESVENPKTKKELADLLAKKKAVVFHERFYKGGHSIPGLPEWLKKEEGVGDCISQRNLSMKSRSSWEPQFVSPSLIPLHDESFPYMIRDNTCLRWELCRAGYSLHLVDDLFMFHRGIKTAKDVGRTKQLQSTNKKRFYDALSAFKQRMDIEYPTTKDECPIFRA
ncbi:hypothetical protein PFISCL1PPCAC_10287, partial [Pristionchus fissidentatus]